MTNSNQTPESRAARAKRPARPVVDIATGKDVADFTSPLLPADVDLDFDGRRYWIGFRYQAVSNEAYDALAAKQQLGALRLTKDLPEGLKLEGAKYEDLAPLLSDEQMLRVMSLGSVGTRDERVALYVPCIEDWNVPDENGDVADFSVDAFLDNQGGIYEAALAALEARFLKSKGQAPGETAATNPPSPTGGDGQSTAPEAAPQEPQSDTSPGGQSS